MMKILGIGIPLQFEEAIAYTNGAIGRDFSFISKGENLQFEISNIGRVVLTSSKTATLTNFITKSLFREKSSSDQSSAKESFCHPSSVIYLANTVNGDWTIEDYDDEFIELCRSIESEHTFRIVQKIYLHKPVEALPLCEVTPIPSDDPSDWRRIQGYFSTDSKDDKVRHTNDFRSPIFTTGECSIVSGPPRRAIILRNMKPVGENGEIDLNGEWRRLGWSPFSGFTFEKKGVGFLLGS